MRDDQRGFALIAVLLVLAVVGVVGAEFAYSMRLEASAARAYKETLIATHLAEAAVEQGIREMVGEWAFVTRTDPDDKCALTFWDRERRALKRLPSKNVTLGAGQFSYCLSDEESRFNVNTQPPQRIDRLLTELGLDKLERDPIVDSLQDWRDPNEEHRLNGAESDDYYLKLPLPYRSKNGNLDAIAELLQIKGVTPAVFNGVDGKPGLAEVVSVKSPGQININTAGRQVLRALDVAEAQVIEIFQARREAPYATVPGTVSGRGLAVQTRTFRIEAEGIVDGQVRARLTAVVQKRLDGTNESVLVLEWSGVR